MAGDHEVVGRVGTGRAGRGEPILELGDGYIFRLFGRKMSD